MAHKTEGDCPLTVNAIIRKRAKDEKISLTKMITRTSEEINVPEKTIEKWVWPKKESTPKKGGASKPLRKHTKPKAKIQLKEMIESIDKGEISDDDLKTMVDKVADKVEKGEASPRVLSKSKTTFKKSGRDYGPPKKDKESDIIKMVNSFHKFLAKLDAVRGKGTANISESDRDTMDNEFKLMVPRLLRLLDWMGIDLQALITNYVNHFQEVQHEKKSDTKGLVSD